MLRKLWAAEKAAWRAWQAALRPPAVTEPESPVSTDVITPAPQATVSLFPERWTLFNEAGVPVKGLHGMTTAELNEIKDWPWRKYDRNAGRYRVATEAGDFVGDGAAASAEINRLRAAGIKGKLFLDSKLVKEF